jgi:hypothetical protein
LDNNIKMDVKEIGSESVDWIRMAQDRDQCRTFVVRVMNIFLSSKKTGINFLKRTLLHKLSC